MNDTNHLDNPTVPSSGWGFLEICFLFARIAFLVIWLPVLVILMLLKLAGDLAEHLESVNDDATRWVAMTLKPSVWSKVKNCYAERDSLQHENRILRGEVAALERKIPVMGASDLGTDTAA